jgi:hypothetical protein
MCDAYIGVSDGRAQALKAAGEAIPPVVPIRGLIDTGASCTCIDPSVLKGFNLVSTGPVPMRTPSTGVTPHPADQYDISLIIPHPDKPALIFGTVAVVESNLLVQGFHALIGRDVLGSCMLVYDGVNEFYTLAY